MSDAQAKAIEVMAEAMLDEPKLWLDSSESAAILRQAWKRHAQHALDALLTAYPQIARALETGMVVVPEEPSLPMLKEGHNAHYGAAMGVSYNRERACYIAMIAAAQESKA
jgi:hypothetical protein